MQQTSYPVSRTATDAVPALLRAINIPDDVASLRRPGSYEKWLATNRLPINWLGHNVVHRDRSCTRTDGQVLCGCTKLSDELRQAVSYLRSRAGRAHGAQQEAHNLAELLREPDATWAQLGRVLDFFETNIHWGRHYHQRFVDERALASDSDQIPRVEGRIDALFDVAASWYDQLVSTRVAERWTGTDHTTYLAAVYTFDDDQTFAPGRRFLVKSTEVVSVGEFATVRRVRGRNTARVLRGTYDNDVDADGNPCGMDDWMMCPEPAGFRPEQLQALAGTLGPRSSTPLADQVRALEAVFL